MKSKVLKPRSRTSWFSHSRSSLAVWQKTRGTSSYLCTMQENPSLHKVKRELNSSGSKQQLQARQGTRLRLQIKIPPCLIAPILSHGTQHTSISTKISRATGLAYNDLPANTDRKTNPLGRTSLCVLRPLTSAPVPILLAHAGQQQLHLIV